MYQANSPTPAHALRLLLDGKHLATICLDDFDVVSARVHGSKVDDDVATLYVHAGIYPQSGESTYLTWVDHLPLQPGQALTAYFDTTGVTAPAGKTIDELYPDDDEAEEDDDAPELSREAVISAVRAKPQLWASASFRCETSHGTVATGSTRAEDHGFAFSIVKPPLPTKQLKISLDTYTLDDVEQQAPGHYLLQEGLAPGGWVRFEMTETQP